MRFGTHNSSVVSNHKPTGIRHEEGMECESSVSPAYDLTLARVVELAYTLVLGTSAPGLKSSNLFSSTWYRRLTVRTSGFQPGNGGFNSPRYHMGRLTQLGECLLYTQEVAGSSPAATTRMEL